MTCTTFLNIIVLFLWFKFQDRNLWNTGLCISSFIVYIYKYEFRYQESYFSKMTTYLTIPLGVGVLFYGRLPYFYIKYMKTFHFHQYTLCQICCFLYKPFIFKALKCMFHHRILIHLYSWIFWFANQVCIILICVPFWFSYFIVVLFTFVYFVLRIHLLIMMFVYANKP